MNLQQFQHVGSMPANIVANLLRADWNYFGVRLTPYIVNGFPEVFDRFPAFEPLEKALIPIEERSMRFSEKVLQPYVSEAIAAAENPESTECVGALAKHLLRAITDDEYLFFKDVVAGSYLKDHIKLPEDTDELIEKINAIPLCEKHGLFGRYT